MFRFICLFSKNVKSWGGGDARTPLFSVYPFKSGWFITSHDLLRHVDLLRLFFALIIRWSCRYSVFVRNAQHRMALPYKDKIVRCIFKCISVFIYIFSKFFKSAGRWGFSHYVNSIFYSFCFNSVLPLIHVSHSTDIKPLLSIFSIHSIQETKL